MDRNRVGDLEIEQDLDWQRSSWRIQRIGWLVLLVFLVAAMIGALGGDGPLREARADGESSVDYDRFTRLGSPTELRIDPAPAAVRAAKLEVAVDAGYWSDFRVEAVTPEPDAARALGGEIAYTFLTGAEPEQVSFRLIPLESGIQHGTVRVGSGETVDFTQMVYP